uniref:Putative acetyltransferase n=1 Tax=Trypanosoma congolense (strain IL3000) TaxID=1068625 RepID=G0UMU1_TRYCI|nr:putative acetyltransferase [Trypanosoma congolense IL3000]
MNVCIYIYIYICLFTVTFWPYFSLLFFLFFHTHTHTHCDIEYTPRIRRAMTVPVSLRGSIFMSTILIVSFASYFMLTCWPILCIAAVRMCMGSSPKKLISLANKLYDLTQELWIHMIVFLLEGVLNLHIAYKLVSKNKIPGERKLSDVFATPPPGKVKLVILNHRCHLDWLMMHPFLARAGITRSLRIVLKAELSKVPVFGWAMQLFRYLFLNRNWTLDRENVCRMMNHYKESDGTVLLLFPEGTDLTDNSRKKCNSYALRNNLPQFQYVLNPRSTGIVEMKNITGVNNIEEIIDITLGYTDFTPGERPTELSLFNGRQPRKIHIVCTRHRFGGGGDDSTAEKDDGEFFTVPSDDEGMKDWLNDRFSKKELLLSNFYSNNPVGFDDHHIRKVLGDDCGIDAYDEDEEVARDPKSTKLSRLIRGLGMWYSVAVLSYWLLSVALPFAIGGYWVVVWCTVCGTWSFWASRGYFGLAHYLVQPFASSDEREGNTARVVKSD